MKIIYFITARGHGRGGHFHSLNHIAAAIGENTDVEIYSLGTGYSEVIAKNIYFKQHLDFNGKNLFSFGKKIKEIIRTKNPDIIHCFDHTSYNVLSLILKNNNFVVNKCGGPNPIKFPYVQDLVLFSKENENWFKSNQKFKSSSIYTIPNRVNANELNINIENITIHKEDKFCFVRIGRIGETYKKSFEDSIKLIRKSQNDVKNKVHLYIIGTIENKATYDYLKEISGDLPVTFLTEDKYTKKASNMLYLADAVIATGRGIMEGTGLEKPILTPSKNSDIPVLVSKNNFEGFLATNFSERNVASERDIQCNLENIKKLIDDKEFYEKFKNDSKYIFEKYFDVQGGVPKYIEVYKNVLNSKKPKKRLFKNLIYQLKTIFSFIR